MKKILLFSSLLVMTWLLLEIPQKLFEKADAKLLEERGESVYELKKIEKDVLLFSEKLQMLVNDFAITDVQYTEKFDSDEIMLEEVALADEIELLLDNRHLGITNALRNGKLESKGFAIEISCEIEKTEYTWEMGTLSFVGEMLEGLIIYDMESKKIFLLHLFDEAFRGNTDMENVWSEAVEYYKGLDVQWAEATVWGGEDIEIFPADMERFCNSTLHQYFVMGYDWLYAEDAVEIEVPVEQHFYNH